MSELGGAGTGKGFDIKNPMEMRVQRAMGYIDDYVGGSSVKTRLRCWKQKEQVLRNCFIFTICPGN